MNYVGIIEKAAKELNLPKDLVDKTYKAFWRFIKDTVSTLPLKEDLTEEEFKKLKVNFNIPSLGKLNCTYKNYQNIKKYYNDYKRLKAAAGQNTDDNGCV